MMRIEWMRRLVLAAAALPFPAIAGPSVVVKVDLSQQQMTVDVDGKRTHAWAVSTARPGYVTPTGSYAPIRMHRMWFSRKYDDAPMPFSIFYSGGFAIHGTTSVRMLGRPASHGCVRLAPGNAAALFALVQQRGMAATRIHIHGTPPKAREPVVAQRPPVRQVARHLPTSASGGGLLNGLFGWSQPNRTAYYAQPYKMRRTAAVQPPTRYVLRQGAVRLR